MIPVQCLYCGRFDLVRYQGRMHCGAFLGRVRDRFPVSAARLRKLRLLAGLSQYEAARRAGIRAQSLANLEAGKSRPKPATLKALKALYRSSA